MYTYLQLMIDPVTAADGYTYEKADINKYIESFKKR
jgi:hypothetical protein